MVRGELVRKLYELGRILFALPIVVFGIQYVVTGRYAGGLPPVAPWAPGGAAGAYLIGTFLVLIGVSIALGFTTRIAATLLGIVFLFCVIVLHATHGHDILHDGSERTRFLEPLALSGAAFVLAGLAGGKTRAVAWERLTDGLATVGLYLFSLPMIIFGYQHYEFRTFLVGLLPGWMPGHLFLILLTGAAMAAAGLAMTFHILGRLAGIWLAIMFLIFVVTLHTPRVLAALHNQDERTSLFVALAFCGASLILAERLGPNISRA